MRKLGSNCGPPAFLLQIQVPTIVLDIMLGVGCQQKIRSSTRLIKSFVSTTVGSNSPVSPFETLPIIFPFEVLFGSCFGPFHNIAEKFREISCLVKRTVLLPLLTIPLQTIPLINCGITVLQTLRDDIFDSFFGESAYSDNGTR